MKYFKTLILAAVLLISTSSLFAAPLPNYFYGNIAIKTDGTLVTNTNITVRITIYDGTTSLYSETFNPVAVDAFGAFTVNVGTGTLVSGAWPAGPATANMKTKAEIDYGSGWVSLGARPTMQLIYQSIYGFSGNPGEINLNSGKILVGDVTNHAAPVNMSGDATISNTGVLTIANAAVTSAKIADGTIVDADVNASAAIAGTKINPNFGLQNVTTTGNISGNNVVASGTLSVTGNINAGADVVVTGDVDATGNIYGTKGDFTGDVIAGGTFQGNLKYGVSGAGAITGGPFNNSGNVTLDLTNTGVVPGAYGAIGTFPKFIVDAKGRLTAAGLQAETDPVWVADKAGNPTITGNWTFNNTITGSITGNAGTATTATNLANGAAGSLPYQSAANTTTFLGIGAANTILTSTGGAPQWVSSLYDAQVADNLTINGGAISNSTITVADNFFALQDNADNTKMAQFELSSIAHLTTRTYTLPNADGTLALTSNVTLQGAYDNGNTITTSGNDITISGPKKVIFSNADGVLINHNNAGGNYLLSLNNLNNAFANPLLVVFANGANARAANMFSTSNAYTLKTENQGSGNALYVTNSGSGYGINVANSGSGVALNLDNSSSTNPLAMTIADNGGAVKLSYESLTVVGNAVTIDNNVSVVYIASDNNGTNDAITMPAGTNGQFLYVVYHTTAADNAVINGYTTTNDAKLTFVYANGAWQLISVVE
jgi:hypothetical protein